MKARLCLLVLLLLPEAGAISYTFTHYSMNIEVGEEGRLSQEVGFTIRNKGKTPISEVEYSAASPPENLRVYDSEGALDHKLGGNTLVLSLREPLDQKESERVTIEYELSDFIANFKGYKILTFSYIPEVNISNFSIKLALPPGSTLASETGEGGKSFSAIYPTPARITTDGKRIIVRWEQPELSAQESFRVFTMYSPLGESRGSFIPWLLLGILLGIVATYLKLRKGGKRVARMMLDEEEQEVYDMLLARGGEILQEEVVRRTGYSKAKVSKLVRKLESKGIVMKEPYRKTNLLRLRKEFGGSF